MSEMAVPGSNTDLFRALTVPILRSIGDVGTTGPVATDPGYPQEAAPFPNSDPYGAQPETETPAQTAVGTARVPIAYERDADAPYADPDWRGSLRVRHIPATERGWLSKQENAYGEREIVGDRTSTPEGGTILPDEIVGEAPAQESTPAPSEPLRRQVKWYRPHEVTSYMATKVNMEVLARRTRIAGALGLLAGTGIFTAYSVWNSYKHGAPLPFTGGEHHAAPPSHTPSLPESQPTPETSASAPSPEPTIEPTQPAPDATTAPVTEPAEHFRTAVRLDHETGRASNVYDWSADALRDAAKTAGLNADQTHSLVHSNTNLHQVNEAFYADNPAVAASKYHYLHAGHEYNDAAQRHAADQIVAEYRPRHSAESHVPSAAIPPSEQAVPQQAATDDLNKEVARVLQKQRDAGLWAEPAKASPARHETLLGYSVTHEQAQDIKVAALAVGSEALIAGSVYIGRHRREAKATTHPAATTA